jgi:choline-sulfatase
VLRDDLLHVPLFVRLPGPSARPARVDAAVSLIDLPPTLLELAGLGVQPRSALHGRSLVPWLRGQHVAGDAERAVLAEVFHGPRKQLAIIERDRKLVLDVDVGVRALHDTARDPAEAHDLSDTEPALADRMQARLLAMRRELDPPAQPGR